MRSSTGNFCISLFCRLCSSSGVVVRNKGRLVAQGHRQEEEIDYDEVFAPVARIEAIRIFLAFASYMGFIVYQMDVKSAFLYGKINEEVYVSQPPGFIDPKYPKKVYGSRKLTPQYIPINTSTQQGSESARPIEPEAV
ncbi:copia protein [Tanacetum coccineum]